MAVDNSRLSDRIDGVFQGAFISRSVVVGIDSHFATELVAGAVE